MVGETGLEPAQDFSHNDLNVTRIPIPPLAQAYDIISKQINESYTKRE